MAVSGNYKVHQRQSRILDVEESFRGGMFFKDTPIQEGFCKVLTNYDIKDQGNVLKPRKAYVSLKSEDLNTSDDYIIHHNDKCLVELLDDDDAILMEYVLLGTPNTLGDGIDFDTSKLFLRDLVSEEIYEASLASENESGASINYETRYNMSVVHDEQIEEQSPIGIYSNIEDNIYLMYQDGSEKGIGRLRISESGGSYEYYLERVSPRDVSPHEAVNYGYNILKDEPYIFSNSVSSTGALQLLGVLPYDSNDNLKFDAQVGEDITFKLTYKYPSGASDYKVQWEVQDVEALSGVQIVQSVDDSDSITPGDPIEHTFPAPYKQFSVIVKVYETTDLSNPVKSIVLANYYLADDSDSSNRNIDVVNYDLGTATGMTTFMHKTVLWGVKNARNTLFFSDINNPSYFPYPQGAEPLSEYIIKAVPLLDTLLVFTETRIYQLMPDYETGSFTSTVIQENLDMSVNDAETITVIRNMVYFRSNGEYFMIVPSGKTQGALQLAPISTEVSELLNGFAGNVREIFTDIYAPELNFDEDWSLELVDNYTYLDNTAIKNVYKYRFTYGSNTRYFEFILGYNTLLRTWSTYILETNQRKMIPFRKIVTSDNNYINIYTKTDDTLALQFIQRDDNGSSDNIYLDGEVDKVLLNYPYLDTGLREHNSQYKKRYREFKFMINNISGVEIQFHDEFYVDSLQRTKFFNYHTELVEDPENPNYGQLVVVKEYNDPSLIPEDYLEEDESVTTTILGYWKLGYSAFPNMDIVRVRLKVSGKGYSGRIKLLAQTEGFYELLNFNWVYRMMNAR